MTGLKHLLFLTSILFYIPVQSQSFSNATIDTLSNFIYGLQFTDSALPSYGAIKKSKGQDSFSGQPYFSVEPYFDHIAAIGMLKSDHPDKCGFVKRWMDWYLAHLDANGQTLNHYYDPAGDNETTCPPGASGLYCNHIDAEDSDPALFWILAYDYFSTTGDLSFFTPSVKLKLENAAAFLTDSLIQPDGLSIALRSYPIKYTMDNSEVYKGFIALSNIENYIYADASKTTLYSSVATTTRISIQNLLFNSTAQLYDHYLGGAVDSTQWYTDGIVSTLWPQLFGVDSINSARSIHHRQVLNTNFNGSSSADWTSSSFLTSVDPFTWASVGYVFSLAGDTTKGYAQADYISTVFITPFPYPPCYVADAGWAIMNMATRYPSTGSCLTTSIITEEKKSLLFYPNPSAGILNVSIPSDESPAKIFLSDILGKEVASYDYSSSCDISKLENGIYFISVFDENGRTIYSGKLLMMK